MASANRWVTPLAVLTAVVAVDSFSYALVLPVLPFAVRQMGGGAVTVAVVFSAFSVCQIAAAPLLGRASDRWGRRPVLLLSQTGTLIGFVVLFFAHTPAAVLVARIIDGVSAGNLAVVYAAVCDRYPPDQRTRRLATVNTGAGIGILLGLGLCAILVGRGFALLAVLGVAASLLTIVGGLLVRLAPPSGEPRTIRWRSLVEAPRPLRRSAAAIALVQVLIGAFAVTLPTLLHATIGASVRTGIALAGLAMLAGIGVQASIGVWMARRAGDRAATACALVGVEAGIVLLWAADLHPGEAFGLVSSAVGAALVAGGLLSALTAATSWLSGSAAYGAGLLMGLSQSLASGGQLAGPVAAFFSLAAGPLVFLLFVGMLGAAALMACLERDGADRLRSA
jgi:MFS transporter, DHA1 family, tetracycline resistance protein